MIRVRDLDNRTRSIVTGSESVAAVYWRAIEREGGTPHAERISAGMWRRYQLHA